MLNPLPLPLNTPEITQQLPGGLLRRSVLPNGVRVLTEAIPGSRSASIGFWIGVGSVDEQETSANLAGSLGSTHFLEHLLFKGTATKSAYDIASAFDRMGADHNALTAKEHTCYHAKVRDADLPRALSLLTEMVCASVLDKNEFETERGVILEELAMAADDLSDVAHEKFFETVLAGDPLAWPIGGTPEIIRAVDRDSVWQHYQSRYTPGALVVTVAGAVNHDAFVAQLAAELDKIGEKWATSNSGAPLPRRKIEQNLDIESLPFLPVQRDSEQVHLLLGGQSFVKLDERRFAISLLNSILGGGMASRLFQEIREKRGLAYTTYSFNASYSAGGAFGIYAACAPENAQQVAQIVDDELAKIASEPVADAELERALGQISGSSTLGLEDSEARMARLGYAELGSGEFWELEASLARLNAVTKADITAVAADLREQAGSRVVVGDIQKAGF
ncbi:MAG: pitrilysin family protein [Microbacteriaceae bacterium]|nr:pitrilysin family protein [Microbacteriaceae bacterium]